jgi:subtilisin family serine protease/sugar lactone lactonase YvrE
MTEKRTLVLSVVVGTLLVLAGLAWAASTRVTVAAYYEGTVPSDAQAGDTASTAGPPFAPGVVLVGLKDGVSLGPGGLGAGAEDQSLSATFARIGVQRTERLFPDVEAGFRLGSGSYDTGEIDLGQVYRLRVPMDADITGIIERLDAHPDVVYAEPDYLAHVITTPDDPLYAEQWGLDQIGAPAAWDVVTGTADVVIAVVDAGLDASHPDLSSRLWTNPGEIPSNSVDDDNNGHVDDIHGWNLVDDNADLTDNTGHGTQVAGVAAAATNNSLGVAGVCWDCRVMVVKVVQTGGVANYSDIAAGVVYAAQKGAEVINVSLGAYSDSATLRAAVAAASEMAIVVAGAGNDDTNTAFYPAAYDDYVLAVAGTTSSDTKTATSNYGAWVDVCAPAEVITTTLDGGGYGSASGTSMAAPLAAGLAGLLRSQCPAWSPDMVRAHVIRTANDIDGLNPGYEEQLGSGRISAANAVGTPAQPDLEYQSHAVGGEPLRRPEPGSTVDLDVILYNDWGDASNVQATLTTTDTYATVIEPTASYGSIPAYDSSVGLAPFRFSVASSAPYGHDIPFTLSVSADEGYGTEIPLVVTTASGITYVHGTLSTQTWTNDRIYVVDNDVGIQAGHTLTIEMGTEVRFAGDYSLSVAGTLIADGTEEQPIRFTSDHWYPCVGDWGQIKFLDSSVDATFGAEGQYVGGSILRRTVIEYAQGIKLTSAAPFISHNTVAYVGSPGLSGSGSSGLVIADNTMMDTEVSLSVSGSGCAIVGNSLLRGGLSVSGSAAVSGNSVANAPGIGIAASGASAVSGNRVVECDQGMQVNGGFVSGNLVANNEGDGLRLTGGSATVVSNTVFFNGGSGVYIQSGTPVFHGNNLLGGDGDYALYNNTSGDLDATGNWWGTTDIGGIQAAIYDAGDQFGLGMVDHSGYLSSAAQEAPAYVQSVATSPDTTLGIETAQFDVLFSRPMDERPTMVFYPTRRGTWQRFHHPDTGLGLDGLSCLVIDKYDNKWIGTGQGLYVWRADGTWEMTDAGRAVIHDLALSKSGNRIWVADSGSGVYVLSLDGTLVTHYPELMYVRAIDIDDQGNKWMATSGEGLCVLRLSGAWECYTPGNSGVRSRSVVAVEVDAAGNVWCGYYENKGVTVLRTDGTWHTYTKWDSGLSGNYTQHIAADPQGNVWFGTNEGLSVYSPAGEWRSFEVCNSEAISFIDDEVWAGEAGCGEWGVAILRHGLIERIPVVQNPSVPGLPYDYIQDIVRDSEGSIWFATGGTTEPPPGGAVLWAGPEYGIEEGLWLDYSTWRGIYEVTSLVPRDTYILDVSSAKGIDGMEVPRDTRYGFTVDYAGQITDQTPPRRPSVTARGDRSDPSVVQASWSASDPQSSVTGYRYAIGSAPDGADVVSWTDTPQTSVTKSGLGLTEGHVYWVSVQARNAAGLWSVSGYDFFFAGQPPYASFLPLSIRAGP